MKITLLGEDSIRYEATPGMLTIEAESDAMSYSPFHMLASALASCTYSVMHSWATHAKIDPNDLVLEISWKFGDDPHRVTDMSVAFTWPSLPANRIAAAGRVAELCTVHATLSHSPVIHVAPATAAAVK